MEKRSKLILVWNKRHSAKSIVLGMRKLVSLITLSIAGLALLLFIGNYLLSEFVYTTKISQIRRNNSKLIGTIYDLQKRIQEMESEINVLNEKDQALRTYADIPAIDRDVRKLGIGGKYIKDSGELDELLPDEDIRISHLSGEIDRLSREIRLECISYEEIYNAFKHRSPQIKSIPSIRPVTTGYISDGFGYRIDPISGKRDFHNGLDLSAPTGTPVYATADGIVRSASHSRTYGKIVKVEHGNGYLTLYAHLSRIFVRPGDVIKRGQRIAEVGNSGRSTASHLHYEVRRYGVHKNPLDYYFTGYIR